MNDLNPLLNPPREPPVGCVAVIDAISWIAPLLAGTLSILAGLAALQKADEIAAVVGMAGGFFAAAGVIFTNWASRIRDGRLAVAHSLGALGIDMADRALSQNPHNF